MSGFIHTLTAPRIVFGPGSRTRTADEIERLGRSRVLLLTDPAIGDLLDDIETVLGDLVVARFDAAVVHTPVEVTERALTILREAEADCIVAVGGGSTTGLAKALASRTGIDQVILPTTYAGSEVTPVIGETAGGEKITRRTPDVLPETVIYDGDLSRALPAAVAVPSAINALAHAVEALYAPDAEPVTDLLALEAVRLLAGGIRALGNGLDAPEVRADLLRGAWLAGLCLASVGMGLHHKLCHTLGGALDLPHAPTHSVLLPHAVAYNAAAAPDAMRRLSDALGSAGDAPSALHDLIVGAGAPSSLRELGVAEADLSQLAEDASRRQYPNPAPIERDGIERLLRRAWVGERPDRSEEEATTAGTIESITRQVVDSFAGTADPRLRNLLTDLVRRLHDFALQNDLAQSEWQYAIDFLTRTGQLCNATRQEFILLSDTLGLSSVVDVLTNSRTPETTKSAVLGPFYTAGPPELSQHTNISAGQKGRPLFVDVVVVDTEGDPVAGAVVDTWQSNDDGFYDVQLPDLDGPALRGRFHTDDTGRLQFRTILPSEYPIPDDGPVGQMLSATGRHPYRAPHLHFMIAADGHRTLITQLFVRGGKYLDSDAVFGVKDSLIVDFPRGDGVAPDGTANEWFTLDYTFRIAQAGER